MAELEIGKHCSLPSCKQLDFLPFRCDGCGEIFCKEHQVKDRHECTRALLPSTESSTTTPYQTYKCSLTDCNRSELVPVPCDKCHLNYCMIHRHAVDHQCSGVVTKGKYMSTTAQHVQSIIESKTAREPKRGKVAKSKKALEMSAKVALMKLKMTATGDLGVPAESRVYMSVQLPTSSGVQPKYSSYWIDQAWSVGRTVDYISDKSKVRNDNNKGNCPKLRIRNDSVLGDDGAALVYDMESKLGELVSNALLYSGSTVELCYISEEELASS